jgi:hypothetical protein
MEAKPQRNHWEKLRDVAFGKQDTEKGRAGQSTAGFVRSLLES